MLVDAALQRDSAAFGGVRAKSFFSLLFFALLSFSLRRLKVRFGLPVASVRAPLWRQWRLAATLGHHAVVFLVSSAAALLWWSERGVEATYASGSPTCVLLPAARRVTGEFRVVA
jgi:hypothetical protein